MIIPTRNRLLVGTLRVRLQKFVYTEGTGPLPRPLLQEFRPHTSSSRWDPLVGTDETPHPEIYLPIGGSRRNRACSGQYMAQPHVATLILPGMRSGKDRLVIVGRNQVTMDHSSGVCNILGLRFQMAGNILRIYSTIHRLVLIPVHLPLTSLRRRPAHSLPEP